MTTDNTPDNTPDNKAGYTVGDVAGNPAESMEMGMPLEFAVDGVDPPADRRAEPGFETEYGLAMADVDRIRRGLVAIAELTPGSASVAVPGPGVPGGVVGLSSSAGRGGRPDGNARWMLAAACVVLLMVLAGSGGWLMWRHGGSSAASLSTEGSVACSRLIAVGTVRNVEPAGSGRLRVTIAVSEYVKPLSGSGSETVTVDDPAAQVGAPQWPVGGRVLVQEFTNGDPTIGVFGADVDPLRQELVAALPAAAGLECGTG